MLPYPVRRVAFAAAIVLAAVIAHSAPALAVSPHVAGTVTNTCASCHIPHAATSATLMRDTGATPGEVPVCLSCHDGTDPGADNVATGADSFAGLSGHVLEDIVDPLAPTDLTNACSDCHKPHGDPALRPKLPASSVNSTPVVAAGNDWCFSCHNDAQDWYAEIGTYPPLATPSRDTTGYPVAGTFAGKTVYVNATANAHASIPATTVPEVRGSGDCRYCHAAHGSANPYDGLNAAFRPSTAVTVLGDRISGGYATACFQCHDGTRLSDNAANIKQFVTHEPGDVSLMASGGHRIKSAGGKLPVNAPLPCYDCHNPHGSSRGNASLLTDELGQGLDTADAASVRQFCLTCHVTYEVTGWDSVANTYVSLAASTARVEGLLRNGGTYGDPNHPDGGYNWLRLKQTAGHYQADYDISCYECHGNDYSAADSNNVHNPGSYSVALHTGTPTSANITIRGVTYGPFACSQCHNVELGPEHDKSTASSNADDCAACHPTPRDSLTPSWDRTTCAQGNCHAGTSPDPMHGTIDADHTAAGPCSTSGCHSTDGAALHMQVGGPGCTACHAPGVTPTLSCGACHPNAHPNSATLNHGNADTCSSCHSSGNIKGVHADDCTSCHPTPATIGTVYTVGCSQTGCHPAATLHSSIPGYSPYHYQDHGEGPDCWDCHGVNECGPCHSMSYERQAPVTTANYKAAYTAAAVVNLSVVDQPTTGYPSGVLGTYYQIDGGPIQTGTSVVVMGPAVGSRSHSVEFWSVDKHYNTEAHKVIYFTVSAGTDTLPPTGTMTVNSGAAYTNGVNVTVNSAVTDPETGVVSMRIDPGTGTFGAWRDYQPATPITLSSTNGIKTVRAEFRDAFGHVLALSDTIYLDTVLPTGTMVVNNNAAATNSLTVTANSNITDSGSGVVSMSFLVGGVWSPLEPYAPTKTLTLTGTAQGNRTLSARFYDGAGNVLSRSDTITYDTIAPTGTMAINNGAASTPSTAVQLNSAVVDERSGINQMRFSNDGSTWSGWVAYAATFNWTLTEGEGAKTVWAQYSDRAGNVLAVADIINLGTSSDVESPTGTIEINGGAPWTNALPATLTLSATDHGGGTVFEMRFSNDGSTWSVWELYNTTKAWTMPAGAGTKTVYVQYRDNSGNVSTGTISDTIGYEFTSPTGTVVINGGATWTGSQSVTLSLTSADTGGSGVSQMRFSNDSIAWSTWEPMGATKAWSLTAGAGIKTVYAQYRDAAGNTSSIANDNIAYDLSYTLTFSAGSGGTVSGTSPQTVNYGESGTTVTAVPDSGYYFLGWSDGKTAAVRTDTVVTANVNATALFAPNGHYKVQFLDDGSGYVSGQWVQGVAPGGSTTAVTAYPHDPYYFAFSYWSNGSTYLYTPTITINNVTSNQTWTAYFTYTGSCPFLYTWDGERYVFEADEFAAGYLGLRTSRGYRRPNPIDYHVLATTPAIKDGALEYKLVEERDETDYLDLAQLYTVDAPADRDVYVERSQAEGVGQFTTLDAVIYTTAKNLQPPPSVIHLNTGEDVRDKVAAKDGDRVILNDDRNQSYTYQTLELDLGDVQDAPQVKLVMDGRTMIPTSPEGRAYSRTFGPQVKFEVQDSAGKWVAVPTTKKILPKPPEFDRPFVLDVTNIWVSESRKVRLTYLYKTYFDAILLDTTADVPVTITELPLESAVLQPHGFNFKAGIGEWYDYVYGLPFAPPSYKLPGNYTKFGDVTPLLTDVDDKFVIFGGGDEITLRYEPPSTSAAGLTRSYLFFSNGYYKTLKEDIPHTVEPLPFAAMSNFPYPDTESYPTDEEHQAYLREWNTRQEGE